MVSMEDLAGKRFGCWVVSTEAARRGYVRMWSCVCDCGTERLVIGDSLRRGQSRSCGCQTAKFIGDRLRGDGVSGTKMYKVWQAMVARCTNSAHHDYRNYGGRGITVCERWKESFPTFLEDMGEAEPGLTLDRKDNNLGYSKENCRWADRKTQNRNTRRTRWLTVNGVTRALSEWAEISGISVYVLHRRVFVLGWEPSRAIRAPVLTRSEIQELEELEILC